MRSRTNCARRDARALGAATSLPVSSMEADLAHLDNGATHLLRVLERADWQGAWHRSGRACGSWPAATTRD